MSTHLDCASSEAMIVALKNALTPEDKIACLGAVSASVAEDPELATFDLAVMVARFIPYAEDKEVSDTALKTLVGMVHENQDLRASSDDIIRIATTAAFIARIEDQTDPMPTEVISCIIGRTPANDIAAICKAADNAIGVFSTFCPELLGLPKTPKSGVIKGRRANAPALSHP